MKSLIAILVFSVSASAFSFDGSMNLPAPTLITSSPLTLIAVTSDASGLRLKADAVAILNDSQELMQSGAMSVSLHEKIKSVQEEAQVSESEALDMLIAFAEEVISKS